MLLNSDNFRSYMFKTYSIVPIVINEHRIARFFNMTREYEQYIAHI